MWLFKILPSIDYVIYNGPFVAQEANVIIRGAHNPVKVKIFKEQLAISFDDWIAVYFKDAESLNEFLTDFTEALKSIENFERVEYESL